MSVTLKCTVGRETYEIEIDLPSIDPEIVSILRTSDYSSPELTPYDQLGPYIQYRIHQRIRAYLTEQRGKDTLP